jgi:Tol biopolymer transport system component
VWTSWNPDGTQLAFVETFLHGSNYANQCYIKVLDRATCTVRTVAIAAPNVWINKPDWARHTDALAYFAFEGNTSKIYTLNLVTGTQKYIVTGYYPSWSPDDTKLVYNYGGYVRTVNVATKVTKVLAADNGLQAQANWRRF